MTIKSWSLMFLLGMLSVLPLLSSHATTSPQSVDGYNVCATNGTDLVLSWSVPADIYGQPLAIERYRVYRSGNPLFVPDQELFSDLFAETPHTFLVLTNVLNDVSNAFYYVSAVAADGQESAVFTRMVSHEACHVPCLQDGRGFVLLSLPYDMPWTNAAGLAGQLAPAVRLFSPDTIAPGFQTWDCLASTGMNFAVQGGDAVGMEVTNACVLHLFGTHGAPRTLQWAAGTNDVRQRWFSLPAQSPYANAAQVASAVGAASKVARWDASNGVYRSWFHLADGWRGDNFAVAPGEGLYVSLRTNVLWRPALPYPRVSVTVSQALEFVESARGLQATAQAADDENDIVEYRWDYDGDGSIDAMDLMPIPSYEATPTSVAVWHPSLWVRDQRGFWGLGFACYQTLSLSLTLTNRIIQSAAGGTGSIGYTSSAEGYFTTSIRDEQGRVIRVLESNAWHEVGPTTLTWDGRDSTGMVAVGLHYVVIEQRIGTNTATYNPAMLSRTVAGLVGGVSIPEALNLRSGGRFPIQYALEKPALVTVRIVDVAHDTLAVVCTNAPRLAGPHEECWDGRLSDGSLVRAGQTFSVEVDAFVLSDNALIVETPLPRIEGLVQSLNRFMPALNPYSDEPNAVTLNYSLASAADVRLEVRAASGRVVCCRLEAGHAAGANETIWAGTDDEGRLVPEGYYSIELRSESGVACGEPSRIWAGVYY